MREKTIAIGTGLGVSGMKILGGKKKYGGQRAIWT